MDPLSFPPIAAILDAAYELLMGLAALLQPVAGAASAALAVILLTLLVRTILIPTGIAQARAEQTRARLAPRLRALQRRYRNDRERMSRETMKLYADEKASPLAGCAPVLVQAPIVGVVYALFLYPVIAGHPNALLSEQLFGVPLGASLAGSIVSGTVTAPAALVFGVILVLIVLVAEVTRRLLRPDVAASEGVPGGEAVARMAGFLQFGTAVVALFAPLAAALYLLVTVSWTLVQRLVLRRRFPVEPATSA
ncbi:YidC/Oxa1 family membrane protein insertase [Microbacterium sp. SLBN-154]|uniref:YidC/Oxa1 family membrane protein insertase n=1 Tax=Microbacterium sp. SLBN-154 TaxID=2768458 RepID=UPI001152A94D|nr:membrane protein insertase YidC [Microbacterium sp. SLBN-154]TQK20554.1 YidC/Oxa1 family membrane protein insertase [Microbacterium sp. SLBN-154]